jgi:hypothetical protein
MVSKTSYQVGFGRPPRHSQFRPGESGNPGGRPKGRRSFKTDIAAALDKLFAADSEKTKQSQFAENLVNDALARKPLPMRIVAQLALALNDNEEGEREGEVTPLQRELIEDFDRRARTDDTSERDGDEC